MAEFMDFGERSPEEITHLSMALSHLEYTTHTIRQRNYFEDQQNAELGTEADDLDIRSYYISHDARYAAAVEQEYSTMRTAVEALASYLAAQERTVTVRQTLADEAARMLSTANHFALAEELTPEELTLDGE